MCGIVGIIRFDEQPVDAALLARMNERAAHRGPDGTGMLLADTHTLGCAVAYGTDGRVAGRIDAAKAGRCNLGFAHRRLAIQDLSDAGREPITDTQQRAWLVFNGEIYNHVELADELRSLGHTFRGRCDAEVLLAAYLQWGETCVERFNGMWAFAIWDPPQHRLLMSRDRFGIKPLYYWQDDRQFAFASELKQLLLLPDLTPRANDGIVYDYLRYHMLDHEPAETFVAGVRRLPGGCCAMVDLTAGASPQPTIRSFWIPPDRPASEQPREETCAEQLKALLQDSIRLRLRSDVPVGTCLSGGLDSSSLVCLMRGLLTNGPVNTFTACFDEPEIDERRYAGAVVEHTGAAGHCVYPDGGRLWEEFDHLVEMYDEPVRGPAQYAQWCVQRLAREHNVTVLLDGQGADELLCGYRKFYFFYLRELWSTGKWGRGLAESLALWRHGQPTQFRLRDGREYLSRPLRALYGDVKDVLDPTFVADHAERNPGHGTARNLYDRQVGDVTRFSIPILMRYEDRNSMAFSREARVPFLDHRLAEFLLTLPAEMKLRGGVTKYILRRAMNGVLPPMVRDRRSKLGFVAPLAKWMGLFYERFADLFRNPAGLRCAGYLRPTRVDAAFRSLPSGRAGPCNCEDLFRFVNLERWMRTFDIAS